MPQANHSQVYIKSTDNRTTTRQQNKTPIDIDTTQVPREEQNIVTENKTHELYPIAPNSLCKKQTKISKIRISKPKIS